MGRVTPECWHKHWNQGHCYDGTVPPNVSQMQFFATNDNVGAETQMRVFFPTFLSHSSFLSYLVDNFIKGSFKRNPFSALTGCEPLWRSFTESDCILLFWYIGVQWLDWWLLIGSCTCTVTSNFLVFTYVRRARRVAKCLIFVQYIGVRGALVLQIRRFF